MCNVCGVACNDKYTDHTPDFAVCLAFSSFYALLLFGFYLCAFFNIVSRSSSHFKQQHPIFLRCRPNQSWCLFAFNKHILKADGQIAKKSVPLNQPQCHWAFLLLLIINIYMLLFNMDNTFIK